MMVYDLHLLYNCRFCVNKNKVFMLCYVMLLYHIQPDIYTHALVSTNIQDGLGHLENRYLSIFETIFVGQGC